MTSGLGFIVKILASLAVSYVRLFYSTSILYVHIFVFEGCYVSEWLMKHFSCTI